jgi:diguanylate cyclase (GGDEF)-like protein
VNEVTGGRWRSPRRAPGPASGRLNPGRRRADDDGVGVGTTRAPTRAPGSLAQHPEAAAVAAAALLLSSAALIYLSLAVPDYIRPAWSTSFAISGVPCVVVGGLLLVRRRLSFAGLVAVVVFGDVAIVLSGFASVDRSGTTAGALLGLPTLFTATFLGARWLAAQVVVATACAWVINALVPASAGVHLVRTFVLVVACTCPAVIVLLLRRQLDRAVLTDPLTGLLNRRGLEAHFPDQTARARRRGLPVVVLLADIDHFKQINDRFGHLVGDEVLRAVARVVDDCVRPEDLVVRLGGEEIAVVLVADPAHARVVGEGIRRQVAQETTPQPVTISIGAAWQTPHPQHADLLSGLLQRADQRMYEAKRSGRNRAVFPRDCVA